MMTNRWFGPARFANICDSLPEVPTPEGKGCAWCGEPIVKGDCGVEFPDRNADGTWEYRPWHQECQMRTVIGSLAHIERRCSHYGGPPSSVEPPAGMTLREEAKIVFARWKAGEGRPEPPTVHWAKTIKPEPWTIRMTCDGSVVQHERVPITSLPSPHVFRADDGRFYTTSFEEDVTCLACLRQLDEGNETGTCPFCGVEVRFAWDANQVLSAHAEPRCSTFDKLGPNEFFEEYKRRKR